jgi:FolB domain-containing protein
MDRIIIKDLLVRGILGINPEERDKLQDIVINVVLYVDVRQAAATDAIEDAVNYKSITKRRSVVGLSGGKAGNGSRPSHPVRE